MLIRMDTMLIEATKKGYGIVAPNVINLESVEACVQAASQLSAPVILDVGFSQDMEQIAYICRLLERRYPDVTFALNLDHGPSYEAACRAVQAGFTSVMIDKSKEKFEENVRATAEICKMAHYCNVSVEAEIGHVGQGESYDDDRDAGLTRVEDAVEFVKRTGVDCLAIAVGTAHGLYKGTPKIDFDRLKAIRQAVDIPLVLHGGSSTGDELLKKAVEGGISKVNIGTDLGVAGCRYVREYLDETEFPRFGELVGKGVEGYKEMLKHYIVTLGGQNKA